MCQPAIKNKCGQLNRPDQNWLKSNWKTITEAIFLVCIFLTVWCLFALPTVIYAISVSPSQGGSQKSHNETKISSSYICTGHLVNQSQVNLCSNASSESQVDIQDEIVCAEGFYLDNSSRSIRRPVCAPLCSYWLSISKSLGNAVVVALSSILAIVSSLIMIILAFWLQRDTMLVQPTVYLVYICLTVATSSSVIIIGVLSKNTVFCGYDNLLESLESETPFCTISGLVQTYALGQISLWIVFHAIGLLRGIAFPFFYREKKGEGALKYIHIATIIVALVLPIVPALLHLIDGYSIAPTAIAEICTGRNTAITYYSLVLPISILFAITTTVLILLFRKILKEFFIKPTVKGMPKGRLRKVQAKLFMIMCYYTLVGVVTISGYTSLFTTGKRVSESVQTYFMCQSTGVQADLNCGQLPSNITFHTLALVSIILLGLMPGVILIFTANCTCFKKCCISEKTTKAPL